jgi:hypothetical protein
VYSRTRPQPQWVSQWRTIYVVAGVLIAVGILLMVGGIAVNTENGNVVATTGIVILLAALSTYVVGTLVQAAWAQRQPINGRVVDRFFEVSGFTPNELPLNASLNEVLNPDTDAPALQNTVVLYWLYVAPFTGGPLHRFLVDREVYDAHPLSSSYDAANPATSPTEQVLVKSVPAQQRQEREEVAG